MENGIRFAFVFVSREKKAVELRECFVLFIFLEIQIYRNGLLIGRGTFDQTDVNACNCNGKNCGRRMSNESLKSIDFFDKIQKSFLTPRNV